MRITVGLVVAGLLLFGASLNDPFHFDDALITNDSNVTNASHWAHFFNPLYLRQLTFFTFYLNHLVGGLNPAAYHATNIVIHVANAVLLFFLLTCFLEAWIAAAAAAIFLVHPIQTEAVLYIYQRSILLACFFSLLGLIALAKGRTWWAVFAFLLAFESKESALAVPVAVALLGRTYQWWELGGVSDPLPVASLERLSPLVRGTLNAMSPLPRGTAAGAKRPAGGRSGKQYGLLVLALTLAAFALFILAEDKTVGLQVPTSPLRYLLTETRVFYTYVRLLFFPSPQSLEYTFSNAGNFFTAAGVALLIAAAWWWRSVSVLAFFILLAPTSTVIPSADAAFEHRLYLPMLSFSVFAAYLISKIPRRTWIVTAVLLVLSILTVRRGTVWSTDIALWENTVKHAPDKARVWFNLGGAYLKTDPDKARNALIHALQLQPHWPEALYDLGLIEQQKQNWPAALVYYQQALAQDEKYWPACNNIGNTLFAMGERARSVEFFERTLRLNPDYWPAQYNIAIVHFTSGRFSDAVPRLRTVLDWRPEFREARYLLATSLTRAGYRSAADEQWKVLNENQDAESRHTPTLIPAPSRP